MIKLTKMLESNFQEIFKHPKILIKPLNIRKFQVNP